MTSTETDEQFLQRLCEVMQRIALQGDLRAVGPLMDMTGQRPEHTLLARLAESFAHMVVKIEAREFELECRIADLGQTRQELELANLDPLTSLPNRMIARDRLRQSITEARARQGAMSVLFLDLDRFKQVNDTLGHAAGDELLCRVTQRLQGCLREGDTLARLGGDEFLCVLPTCGEPEAAQALAGRMIGALTQRFPLAAGVADIGTSIGLAHFPRDGQSVDELIASADAGLYEAKRSGRNCWRYAPPAAGNPA
ncbi:GGDEF domain-containing protein [Ramlibacter sp. H39-3-26]|uniref:GGDEF domain-containing protein n=1 Tax=Curvibacter soli TaxID=3031331 RepID=UPI0023DC8523|nr:GGDEF domain-containing protein [Ramlibacter sp. H39-3-26]MDF1484486.1 GGDEF domain-containing protein [Ramlibacter sp. H39-3-26]